MWVDRRSPDAVPGTKCSPFHRRMGSPRASVHGTFATAAAPLPRIAAMGFNVVYLPPIHPIGTLHRKGRNNAVTAEPGDVGSPWAIGSADGGHDAVHPTLAPRRLRPSSWPPRRTVSKWHWTWPCSAPRTIRGRRTTRQWFTELPDGTIAYAENPPKKYQDIYPLNFDNARRPVRRGACGWFGTGWTTASRYFGSTIRTPNHRTSGRWLIGRGQVCRPRRVVPIRSSPGLPGSTNWRNWASPSRILYFTWRTAKWGTHRVRLQIAEHADCARPNLFTNTPTSCTRASSTGARHVRHPSRAGIHDGIIVGVYRIRIFEHESVGKVVKSTSNSEKYELRPRDFEAAVAGGRSLEPFLRRLNEIRRMHPALCQMRTIKFHHIDNDALLAYSKFDPVTGDSVLVVVTLNALLGGAGDTVWLDMECWRCPG